MHGKPKILIFLLRVCMGWILFYSGVTKILDTQWSAKDFLAGAKNFREFYAWFALPQNVFWVDFMNRWGQVAIGGALILGVFVGVASLAGALMMALYYFPGLDFPFIGANALLIDEHIIYILAFLLLYRLRAGKIFGLSQFFGR